MPFEDTDDIAADIRSAIEADASPSPIVEPVTGSEATGEAESAVQQSSEEAAARARDEQGRFARKEEVAKPPEQAQPVVASPVAPAEPPTETIPPPHSATAAVKAAWDSYPLEIRKELVRIEQEAQKGKTEWQSRGEKLNRFEALFAPHREKFAVQGLDEFSAITALLNAQTYLERDPNGAIAYLARQFGANPLSGRQDPGQQQFQQPQPQLDPHILTLSQQVQSLQQTLAQQQQARETEEFGKVQSDVEVFRKDNLYFDNVKLTMGKLIQAGEATGLQDAYDKACWANPEIRALLIAAQAPKPAPPVAPPQSGTPAGLSVTGSPGLSKQGGQADPNSSIEDDVRTAIAMVSGRV
jgi:hypothetical protein